MGLLISLGLRRDNDWDPPTLLDKLLEAPLHMAIMTLYSILLRLRGRPFGPPQGRPGSAIRVVCIADTHDQIVRNVPDGDLLIHAGDLTNEGTVQDIQRQLDWLSSLPHRHKVVVAGNHDSWFDDSSRRPADRESGLRPDLSGVHYLEDATVQLEFEAQGRVLNVYGSPHIPKCGDSSFAFQYLRHLPPWDHKIPRDTDVLVTHTPPRYHLDIGHGCAGLLEEIWRVRPRLHVFGHTHSAHGREAVYFDDCQRAYESLMARPRRGLLDVLLPQAGWLDAIRVVLYGVNAVLFKWLMLGPGPNHGSLMINAAQMYRNTGKMGNKPQVVDI